MTTFKYFLKSAAFWFRFPDSVANFLSLSIDSTLHTRDRSVIDTQRIRSLSGQIARFYLFLARHLGKQSKLIPMLKLLDKGRVDKKLVF